MDKIVRRRKSFTFFYQWIKSIGEEKSLTWLADYGSTVDGDILQDNGSLLKVDTFQLTQRLPSQYHMSSKRVQYAAIDHVIQ